MNILEQRPFTQYNLDRGSRPGIHEKSNGVFEINLSYNIKQYLLVKISQGVRKFYLNVRVVREHEKVGNR